MNVSITLKYFLFIFIYAFVCVCVCVCVCVWCGVCIHMGVNVCTWVHKVQSSIFGIFLHHTSPCLLRKGLLLYMVLKNWQKWPTSELQGPACLLYH